MNFRFFYLIAFIVFGTSLMAQNSHQFSIGIESNSQYYVDDAVTGDFTEDDNFRSNNYIKLDYSYTNFSTGLQLESYAPQALLNYSPKYKDPINIGTYFVKYTKDTWDVTLGYFYEQFGSGLILRSWEDRQLGINNAIRGGRINYKPNEHISLTALYGNQRVGFSVSKGQMMGFDSNFDLTSLFEKNDISLQLGLSYLGRYEATNSDNAAFSPMTHALSGRLQLVKGNFYTDIESVLKSKDALVEDAVIFNDKLFYGNAFLLNMGYSKKGLGITGTFRRMENMSFYSDREATGNTFNEQIVNYLPALTKQHDYSLANIYVYQAQPGLSFINPFLKAGEIGGQVDIYYKIKKKTTLGGKYGTKLALNFSNWNGLGAKFNTEYRRVQVGLLDFGERYYTDINFEIRKKFTKKVSGILMYSNLFYNKKYIEEKSGTVNANVLVAESTYKFNSKKSVRLEAQHLWTQDDKKNWIAATTEFNMNRHISIFATDMYNYGNNDESHRDHYYIVGGSYSKNRSRFALSYGRQRGGLLCVGGVCREVPAATGFTFNITTAF